MKEKSKSKVSLMMLTIILLIIGIFNIFPFIFMISSSFKSLTNIFEYPIKIIPREPILDNYKNVLTGSFPFLKWYGNTILMVVSTILFKSFIISLAAYAFSRLKFKGRDKIFFIMLTAMLIPADVLIVPRYIVYKYLGITDSILSMILLYSFDIYFVFLLRQFFLTIPKELSEAAVIDGCSHFKIYARIILPNAKPGIITMILFTFIWQWNDFMNPMIFITDIKKQVLSVGLAYFQGRQGANYPMQMAGATLIIVPVIILFLSAQKYFVEGIASSGLKG